MRKRFAQLENWFIGDYLKETQDLYVRSKIRLIYKFSLLSALGIIISLPTVYTIQFVVFTVTMIALLFISSIPFLLKYFKSYKLTGKVLFTLSILNLINIYCSLNRIDSMGVAAWFIAIIIIASFTLGKRWGLLYLGLFALTVLTMVFFKTIEYTIYDTVNDLDFVINSRSLWGIPIPIAVIFLTIMEFLNSEKRTKGKMQTMVEAQNALIEKLKVSEGQNRKFIEDADDLIYELDGGGRFSYVNPAFEKIVGYNLGELKDRNFNFFIVESYKAELFEAIYKQVKDRREIGYHEFPIKNKKGEEIWLGQKVVMSFKDRRMVESLCIARDITDNKNTQRALIQAKEEAVKANQAKAEFLSAMSHEIRTPMNALIGMTHLLLMEKPRPDQVENLNIIKFSTENLISIINDIFDFSKIESGELTLEHSPVSLKYILNSIHQALSDKAEDKNVKLLNKFDPRIPEYLMGDSVRLSQILNNLIGNALKFTNQGYVIMQTSLRREEGENVIIDFSVIDSGIGIEEDKLEVIFDTFTQACSSTTRKFGGAGLGLAITKSLLELHDSEIKVQSILGKGAHFYFSIVFKKCLQNISHQKNESQKEKPGAKGNLEGVSILLVEDNKVNQMVAQKFISKWGGNMEIAENGAEAIDMVKNKTFDLVLMDLQMPVMGGMEATKKIRKLGGKFKFLPIIALTASSVLEVQEEAINAGMDDFLTKPFDPKMLLSRIQAHALASKGKRKRLKIPE